MAKSKKHTHINSKGQFQSDKYPKLPPDKIILSFKDQAARDGLWLFASRTKDKALGDDIMKRISEIEK